MPMFFRACRHHSTKSAKWGAFDTVCPLPPPTCLQVWVNCPLCPGSAAYAVVPKICIEQEPHISKSGMKNSPLSWWDIVPNYIALFEVMFWIGVRTSGRSWISLSVCLSVNQSRLSDLSNYFQQCVRNNNTTGWSIIPISGV